MGHEDKHWTLDALMWGWTDHVLPALPVRGMSQDSRRLQAGDLYLATAGAHTHGLHFAEAAVQDGAVAVACSPEALQQLPDIGQRLRVQNIPLIVVPSLDTRKAELAARFYHHPDRAMKLIAVTGTDGKTSVCCFIADAFAALGRSCGYVGTLGWGLGKRLKSSELTTPDPISLYRMLADMRSQGAELVALEASSHGLAERRLDGLLLDVAVLTNFGRDHLDYHGSLESYRQAKARLFDWPDLSTVVVNQQDALGRELLQRHAHKRCLAFARRESDTVDQVSSSDSQADAMNTMLISAHHVQTSDEGLRFTLQEVSASGSSTGEIDTALLGRFNVDNLLACYAGLRACDVAANEARRALSFVTPVAGRMERFVQVGRPTVVVDYSHTPQALSAAIAALREHCRGRLWVVFGCGGDRDSGKRAPMAAAAEAADRVILTDDNPRNERSQDIIADAMLGFSRPDEVKVLADRGGAIAYVIAQAQRNDWVLIAGKGHEDYQIIGNTSHQFSDREAVLCALERAS